MIVAGTGAAIAAVRQQLPAIPIVVVTGDAPRAVLSKGFYLAGLDVHPSDRVAGWVDGRVKLMPLR